MVEFKNFKELLELCPDELKARFEKLKSNPENTKWHPEGNTFAHIEIVVNKLIGTGDIDLILSGLFHDVGKLETTKHNPKSGQPSAYGHELVSANIVDANSEFIMKMGGDLVEIRGIVLNHMKMKVLEDMRPTKRQKVEGLPYFNKLLTFTRADTMVEKPKIEN